MPLINDATTDPDSYILEPGQRLLMDSPPEYDPETQALRRVEPDFSRFGIRGLM
jgi:hypothetical protein